MNEKITLQDIVDLLVQRQNITKKDAEVFVKAMFDLIEEVLEREKCVKVKGLGLFKLIRIESRESVNINTGERFEIQGHSKISFTPETAVRDLINRPFAHFEAVPLNDDTVLMDTLESEDVILDGQSEELENLMDFKNQRTTFEKKGGLVAQEESKEMVNQKMIAREEESVGKVVVDNRDAREQELEEVVKSHFSGEGGQSENNTEEKTENILEEKKQEFKVRKSWYIILVLLFVCVFIGYKLYQTDNVAKSVMNPVKPPVEGLEKVIQPNKSELLGKDTCLLDNVQSHPLVKKEITKEDSTKKQYINEEEKSTVLVLSPKEDYEIVGILQNHTICSGETLRKISLKYYGTKELSSYIVRYNQDVIKNPDNVPVGTIIKIPELKQK